MFVAEVERCAVGMLELRIRQAPARGAMLPAVPSAGLGIAVGEAWRGRGLGTALMEFADRWAVEHDCERIVLDMSSANTGALRLYERLGYRTYGLLLGKELRGIGAEDGAGA